MAHSGIRQRANIVLPEQAIPGARNQVVLPSSEAAWKYAKQLRPKLPHSCQFLEHCSGALIARKHTFGRFAIVEDDVKGIQRVWIQSMPFENRPRETALQSRETKVITPITLQNEPNKPIA